MMVVEDEVISTGRIMSWYHSKILRIRHGNQFNSKKRYADDNHILSLFDGTVFIEEKIDGKLSCIEIESKNWAPNSLHQRFSIIEDLSGKNSPHRHILNYKRSEPVILDTVDCINGNSKFCHYIYDEMGYGTVIFIKPNLEQINQIIFPLLEIYSKMPSHYGSKYIEGLVLKNYDKQLMAKWIDDQFEDKL